MGGAFDELFARAVLPQPQDMDKFFAEAFCRFAAVSALKLVLMHGGCTKDTAREFIMCWKRDQLQIMEDRFSEDDALNETLAQFGAKSKLMRMFRNRINAFVSATLKAFFDGLEDD